MSIRFHSVSGAKYAVNLEAKFGQRFRCTVGRCSQVDFQLPAEMMDIGREEFILVGREGKVELIYHNPFNRFLLDGRPFESGEITMGEHTLSINDHEFVLILS